MASRSTEQRILTRGGGRSIVSMDGLSRWRSRLGAVAATLVEIFQAGPAPAPVRVPATRGRKLPRR